MGVQHGSECRGRIHAFYDFGMELFCSVHGIDAETVLRKTADYLAPLREYCPHLLEELEGESEGAGLTLDEIL